MELLSITRIERVRTTSGSVDSKPLERSKETISSFQLLLDSTHFNFSSMDVVLNYLLHAFRNMEAPNSTNSILTIIISLLSLYFGLYSLYSSIRYSIRLSFFLIKWFMLILLSLSVYNALSSNPIPFDAVQLSKSVLRLGFRGIETYLPYIPNLYGEQLAPITNVLSSLGIIDSVPPPTPTQPIFKKSTNRIKKKPISKNQNQFNHPLLQYLVKRAKPLWNEFVVEPLQKPSLKTKTESKLKKKSK